MKAKKLATALLAGVLAVSMAVPAFATGSTTQDVTDNNDPYTAKNTSVPVTYNVLSTYTIRIPKNIELTKNGGTVGVTATDMNIDNRTALAVYLGSNSSADETYIKDKDGKITGLTLTRYEDAENATVSSVITFPEVKTELGAAVNNHEYYANGAFVAMFRDQTNNLYDGGELTFGALQNQEGVTTTKAGSYRGTVCFTAVILEGED